MRLDRQRCLHLLDRAERGVLATLHPIRGVDAVPACFVVDAERLAIPIDRVKPKGSGQLQRVRNLDHDARAALLCDHWDSGDWSRLWWVRASLERGSVDTDRRSAIEERLRLKYRQYRDEAFEDLLVFRITGLSGWAVSEQ